MKTKTSLYWMAAVVIGTLTLIAASAQAQEVVITDFPLGVGGDIAPDFFEPYYPQLQTVVDTLAAYPLARAVIVGSADGYRYDRDHDAKNPGLSVGRAHALRNLLLDVFGADSSQLVVQSVDVPWEGGRYRSVIVTIDRDLAGLDERLGVMLAPARVDTHTIEVHEVTRVESGMGLRLAAGASSSPYGVIPIVSAAVHWRQTIIFEAVAGHQLWTDGYMYGTDNLAVWSRTMSLDIIYYPWETRPIGFIGGWTRFEEMSKDYHEYTQLSEGPVLGVTVMPWHWAQIAGMWQPSRNRDISDPESEAKHDQFVLRLTVHTDLGGAR
jgi:hypothetical protein